MIIWHILFLKIWGQRIEVACFSFQTKPSHLKWYYWPNASQNAPFSADREARPGSARWMETGRNAGTPAMETMTAGHAKMLNSKAWAHSWVWWADNITFSLLVKKGKISLVSPSVAVIYCILALDVLRFRLFFFYWLQSVAKIQTGKSCRAWGWWKAAQRSEIKNKDDGGQNQKRNKLLYATRVQLFHLGWYSFQSPWELLKPQVSSLATSWAN